MNKNDLIRLRSRVLTRIADLDCTIENARVALRESSETIPSFLQDESDSAKGEVDLKNAVKVYQHSIKQRENLRHALTRMESGCYGSCQDCGEDIAIRRLEAMPGATLCVPCQRDREFGFVPEAKIKKSVNTVQIRWAA